MDFTSIIAQVWGTLGWFIPLILLIGLLKSPWAKGHIGELLVRLFAHWQLDEQTYRRLHNVTLNTPDGTTQIDHVHLPLRQNYKHLKALEATLGVNPEHLHSVITFVGGSTFKTEVPANVTQGIGFIRYIKSFQQPVFSEAEVDAMLQNLQTGRRAPTHATHREHVQNLKRRSDPTAERQCPKCVSSLVIRIRKTGANAGQQFWGCPTFPKCKTMQSL